MDFLQISIFLLSQQGPNEVPRKLYQCLRYLSCQVILSFHAILYTFSFSVVPLSYARLQADEVDTSV
jgi:hypothetical protein